MIAFRRFRRRFGPPLAAASLCLALAGSAHWMLPLGREAFGLLTRPVDPARLADLQLDRSLTADRAVAEIESALTAGDAEMAASFLALADARHLAVPDDLRARVEAAGSRLAEAGAQAQSFGRGFVWGQADDLTGLAGSFAADLTLWGDVRDLANQGDHWLRGETVDPLMVGLATAGVGATAASWAAFGTPVTVRAGLTGLKLARRTGALGVRLGDELLHLMKNGRKAQAMSAVADLGRAGLKGGTRATLVGLRQADSAADLAKLRRLSEAKGGQTLAILRTIGRGAFALGELATRLALWVLAAVFNVLGLIAAFNGFVISLLRLTWKRAGTA